MKNLIVANFVPGSRTAQGHLREMIMAQIENSLSLGWPPSDLVVVSNIDIDIPALLVRAPVNSHCITGSKIFALEYLFSIGAVGREEVWWTHDLDAWQNFAFSTPAFSHIAMAEYSTPKFNGGSLFIRYKASDLISHIADLIRRSNAKREEPAINAILRDPMHRPRVTTLNSTFNVGCSAFAARYQRSDKPVLVSHFHPLIKSAWRTHVLGRNGANQSSTCSRLVDLLVRRFHGGIVPT